jgi:hypothetical protein
MKTLTIIMLSFAVCGCATSKTYYACRDGGGTREYCSSYAGTPSGNVLTSPGPVLASDGAMQTAAVGSK